MKLVDILPKTNLECLSIASNFLNYFFFEYLTNSIRECPTLTLKMLDISNTKLCDKNGIDLFDAIINCSQIASLNLSRNSNLGFKFASSAINILKIKENYALNYLDISYCAIS